MSAICTFPFRESLASSEPTLHFSRPREAARTLSDSILQRVSTGDQPAVRECLDRYAGLVWSLARRFCFNQSEAEDAVQEIFLDVWKSAPRYDPAVASEATFIAMIARRRLIDRRRRASRQPDAETIARNLPQIEQVPGRQTELTEEAGTAARALESLRPEQQRVLRLSIYQGLSHEKIAEATGLPLGTVKTHVRRGLIRIREILSGSGASDGTALGPSADENGAFPGSGSRKEVRP